MFDIFVSYDANNRQWAGEFKRAAESMGHASVFLAHEDIETGALWRDEIRSRLQSADVLIVLISDSSIKSRWVRHEFGAGDIRGIPILMMSIDGTIPESSDPLSVRQCKSVKSPSDAASHAWNGIHSNFQRDTRRVDLLIDGLRKSSTFDETRSVFARCEPASSPLPRASWEQALAIVEVYNHNSQVGHANLPIEPGRFISSAVWLLRYLEQSGFQVHYNDTDGRYLYVCKDCHVLEAGVLNNPPSCMECAVPMECP